MDVGTGRKRVAEEEADDVQPEGPLTWRYSSQSVGEIKECLHFPYSLVTARQSYQDIAVSHNCMINSLTAVG
eukprot:5664638-Amphidinium_carterae.1